MFLRCEGSLGCGRSRALVTVQQFGLERQVGAKLGLDCLSDCKAGVSGIGAPSLVQTILLNRRGPSSQ
jgi:hypothetical protein